MVACSPPGDRADRRSSVGGEDVAPLGGVAPRSPRVRHPALLQAPGDVQGAVVRACGGSDPPRPPLALVLPSPTVAGGGSSRPVPPPHAGVARVVGKRARET